MAAIDPHFAEFKSKHLLPGENIIAAGKAIRDKQGFDGTAILTDKRVAFIRKGLMSTKFEPWPIEKISSVESERGILFLDCKLHTSGDTMMLRFPDKNQGERWVGCVQDQMTASKAAPPVPAAPTAAADPIERLEKLAKLKEAGVVNEEEYAKLRQQILDGI